MVSKETLLLLLLSKQDLEPSPQILLMRLSSTFLKRLQQRVAAAVNSTSSRNTTEGHRPIIVHKRSLDILHNPLFNKGTAFSFTERDRAHIRGLLPPNVMSFGKQTARFGWLCGFIADYGVPLMVVVLIAASYIPSESVPEGIPRRRVSPNP